MEGVEVRLDGVESGGVGGLGGGEGVDLEAEGLEGVLGAAEGGGVRGGCAAEGVEAGADAGDEGGGWPEGAGVGLVGGEVGVVVDAGLGVVVGAEGRDVVAVAEGGDEVDGAGDERFRVGGIGGGLDEFDADGVEVCALAIGAGAGVPGAVALGDDGGEAAVVADDVVGGGVADLAAGGGGVGELGEPVEGGREFRLGLAAGALAAAGGVQGNGGDGDAEAVLVAVGAWAGDVVGVCWILDGGSGWRGVSGASWWLG